MNARVFVKRGRKTYEFVTRGDVNGDCWPKCALKSRCSREEHPCDYIWWAAKTVMDHMTGLKEVKK